MKIRKKKIETVTLLIASIGLICMLFVFDKYQPSKYMVAVTSVENTKIGTDPIISVDWKIRQSFNATWVVDLQKQTDKGYKEVCSGSGTSRYDVQDFAHNEHKLFRYWIGDTNCLKRIKPGIYRVSTGWSVPNGVFINSVTNTFKITQ